jgi:hypothetical protein
MCLMEMLASEAVGALVRGCFVEGRGRRGTMLGAGGARRAGDCQG